MDDLDRFASIRPTVTALADADRERLRARLTDGNGAGTVPFDDGAALELPDAAPTRSAPRRRAWAPASALVAVAAATATLAYVGTRPTPEVQAPATPSTVPVAPVAAAPVEATTSTMLAVQVPASSAVAGTAEFDWAAPPRIAWSGGDWTLDHAWDSAGKVAPSRIAWTPGLRWDGPSVDVQLRADGFSSVGTERTVTVAGADATLSGTGDDLSYLQWHDRDGNSWEARAWKVAEADLIAIADGVSLGDGSAPTFATLPTGFVSGGDADANRYAEYRFSRPDGHSVQVDFYPGGARAAASRGTGDVRSDVSADSETFSIADYGQGRYRADVARGYWVWEFDGEPFGSVDEFMAVVTSAYQVDEATWQASLPAGFARTSDLDSTLDALLDGVPLPSDFDRAALSERIGTLDRYQLIATASSAVACAWFDEYFKADSAGDTARKDAAAAALATSHDWPMLHEIDAQGGYSSVLWDSADSVNGGPGVATGAGPMPPTRDALSSSLGCVFDTTG